MGNAFLYGNFKVQPNAVTGVSTIDFNNEKIKYAIA